MLSSVIWHTTFTICTKLTSSLFFVWIPASRGIPGNGIVNKAAQVETDTTLSVIEPEDLNTHFLHCRLNWQSEWENIASKVETLKKNSKLVALRTNAYNINRLLETATNHLLWQDTHAQHTSIFSLLTSHRYAPTLQIKYSQFLLAVLTYKACVKSNTLGSWALQYFFNFSFY